MRVAINEIMLFKLKNNDIAVVTIAIEPKHSKKMVA